MHSDKQQHGACGGDYTADYTDNGVNFFEFRIVLFFDKVVYICAENENTDDESDDFNSHYFFLHFNKGYMLFIMQIYLFVNIPEYEIIDNTIRVQCFFEETEQIAGVPIDHSFLKYKKELLAYGYVVKKFSMKAQTVLFVKKEKTQ